MAFKQEEQVDKLTFIPIRTAAVMDEATRAVQACSAAAQALRVPLGKVLGPNDELMKAITLASNTSNITKAQIIPG